MANHVERQTPWNELDYYKEGQLLYGRDELTWKVTNGICQNLQTVIYGQSGIGKSSLLFAGVFPRLRKEKYFPVFIRLGMSQDLTYIDTVIKSIISEAERVDESIGKEIINYHTTIRFDYEETESTSWKLWAFLNSTQFSNTNGEPYIPVLVFDQFEEVLNNVETHKKAEQFLLDIYSLLDDTRIVPDGCVPYSNFRFVISLREDYLYCLEDIIDKYNLNELRYNRFRIAALDEKSAKEVILKTSHEAGGCIEVDKEDDICKKIIDDSKNFMGEISTYMLSLICSTQYMNSNDHIIRYENLTNNTENLYQYYCSKISEISYGIKDYLEKVLVTRDGRRSSIDIRDAIESQRLDEFTIDKLVETRLIRKIISGDNSIRIEFIHDKITSVINRKRKTLFEEFKHAWKHTYDFNGRANQREYAGAFLNSLLWGGTLFYTYLCSIFYSFNSLWCLIPYYIFVYSFPIMISCGVRRCHDAGVSGWNYFNPFYLVLQKPSSMIPYKGKYSKVNLRRESIFYSLNNVEYCSMLLQASWLAIILSAMIIPLLILFFLWDYPNLNTFDTIIIVVIYVIFFVLLIIKGIVPMRVASSKHSYWWTIVPILDVLFIIRGLFPYKEEKRIKIDKGVMNIICFMSTIILSLLFGCFVVLILFNFYI